MPTLDDIIAQREAVEAQRLAISSEIERLNQVAQRDPRFAFKELHQKAKDDLNHAVFPLKDKIRVLHDQASALDRAYRETARQQKAAEQAPILAQRAAIAQQRAQSVARKEAGDNLENATARAFGLGPKKGIDYVTQQGAFYDPEKRQIAVPLTTSAKLAVEKAGTPDTRVIKKVDSELNNYLKGAYGKDSEGGALGKVNPASFFDKAHPMPWREDEDGNRIYSYNGREVKIDGETAKDWEKEYQDALPTPPSEAAPKTGVKYIPVDTFRQARGALEQIKGPSGEPDPVEYQLARENRNYLAQPAIAAAVSDRANVPGLGASVLNPARAFNNPRPVPATVIAGQAIPEVIPDRSATVPSIEPGRDIPNLKSAAEQAPINAMSYLNSGVNPIFAQIAQRQKQIATAPDRAVARFEGQISAQQATQNAAKAVDRLGPDATPEQISAATEALNQETASANQAPSAGYDLLAKVGNTANSILRTIPEAPLRGAANYLNPANNSFTNSLMGIIPTAIDRPDKEKIPELQKQFAIDLAKGAIPKTTTQQDYVNFFLNGPQESNLDSGRYVPADQ